MVPLVSGTRGERRACACPRARAREKLNAGGVDTMGRAVSEAEIRARVLEGTRALCAGDEARAETLCAPRLDDAEVRSRWWSLLPESADDVSARLAELFRQIRYCPAERIVLVGHSHLIREILRANLHASFEAASPGLAAQLKKLKLSNCGVAKLSLDFEGEAAPIRDVQLLLNTELVP